MSDYAGSLVGRALGVAPMVHPRVASRYEGSPAVESVEAVNSGPPERSPTPASLPAAGLRIETREAVAPPPTPEATLETRRETRTEEHVIVQREKAPMEFPTPPRIRPPVIESIEERADEPALLVPAWQAVPGTVSPTSLASPVPLNPPAFPRSGPDAESMRPIVRVHINRVEVRAPQQPDKPVKASPAAAPKPMSLDAYLRSRQGGSR